MKKKDYIKLVELSTNLIKAIDENSFEGQDRERENDTDIFITERFIADELVELRDYLKELNIELKD